MSQVILVNEQDEAIAVMDKMQAHQEGALHRAFSIFIFNSQGDLLLQQRSANKYHSGGLWSNACCSHPRPGEEVLAAAHRRLQEELGFDTTLSHAFTFTYQCHFENGLSEHEIDHVFIGTYDGALKPAPQEVMALQYQSLESVKRSLQLQPQMYTAWFALAFPRLEAYLAAHPQKTSHQKKAIVIGAGIAGMATAIRLALQGFAVQLYEKNHVPGGKMDRFGKDGFQFDTGPSVFTRPQELEQLFADAGESLSDYLQYALQPQSCTYFFENGKQLTAYHDKALFAADMHQRIGEPEAHLQRYLEDAKKLYEQIGSLFIAHPLKLFTLWRSKKFWKALAAFKWVYAFKTLHGYNRKKFQTAEMQQVFNRFATYSGSSPYQAPAMLSLIAHVEMNEGVFFPKGGINSIVQALYQLAIKKGVQFYFDSPVEHIIHAHGRAKGVVVHNQNKYADVLVSNVDIYYTWKHLVGREDLAQKISRQSRSSSALIFYWGIGTGFEQLQLHNILFGNNYREEFDSIFKKGKLPASPSIYIHISAKAEPRHAPAGKENWYVMINVPAQVQDMQALQQQARQLIMERINQILQTDIAAFIESETIVDPLQLQQQSASYLGAIYGSSSNSRYAAFVRQGNKTSIQQLYVCGGTVHPGGGIPLCLHSAAITASLIARAQKEKTH